MKIIIHPALARRMFRFFVLALSCLILIGFVTQSYVYLPKDYGLHGALSLLDPNGGGVKPLSVDTERSVPTWFASALLLLCSMFAFSALARNEEHTARYAGRWKVLSIVLLLMSLDEAVGLHERTIEPLRSALKAGGPFYYAWVIPALIFVLAFALAYRRFLLDLSSKTRRLVAVAGTLYVCGALIMEMVGGAYADAYGGAGIAYLAITSVEECLEMLGLATLLYALMLQTGKPEGR